MGEDISLILGDCIEKIKYIEDGSVDLVLTDIPYSECNMLSNGLRELDKSNADKLMFDYIKLTEELVRVCRGSIYIFCGINQLSRIREVFQRNKLSTRALVWEKTNPSPMNGDKIWLSGIELCAYGKKPKATFNGHCRNCVLRYPNGSSKKHPTEKNINLFIDIILTSSNENDLVLDCCMGSGTTGVACLKTNRKFIGIELNEEYFSIAKNRIGDALIEKESKLF